ncbi:MAG: TIGR02391 family protein [Chitinophagaceae bacterium]|nr:TIGR02391 family protein [Chitinophagaceae bacterium]
MKEHLETIIETGEDLLHMHQHEAYEEHVEDVYLDVTTKAKLFFDKLKDDPLNLKQDFLSKQLDSFDESELYDILGILKKAKCYFEVPPSEVDSFWEYIHPLIRAMGKDKFDNGFYADAVETALKEVNNIIKNANKKITGQELDGASLMTKVFSVANPVFSFADITTETGKSIQQGYMQIFAGAMTGIRNPKAHNNMLPDKNKTIHLLFIASFMTVKIEELGLI